MAKLTDLYKGTGTTPFNMTRSLPNQGGLYSLMGTANTTPATMFRPPVAQAPAQFTPPPVAAPAVTPSAPLFSPERPAVAPNETAPESATLNVPQNFINPTTGQLYTAKEIVANMAKKIPLTNSDLGKYAGDAIMAPDQTVADMKGTARDLNNARNDLSVGATDPYKVGKDSGIDYSPAQLSAIEKAYAGIYDPALNDVFTRIDEKEKKDASELAQKIAEQKALTDHKNTLAELAVKHGYDLELKRTPSGTDMGAGGSGLYVPGANPAVDAWAQRIFDGSAKITDIPASQKGMRDAVVVALQASGNTLAGKPTVTELGKQAALGAKELMRKYKAGEGTSAVGSSRIFGGSIAIPGTDKADFVIDFQNLKDMLSLEGVKYLKGQGAVSDAERALLANAITKLNLSQSETDFQTTLQGIIDRLSGDTAGVLRSPDGTQEVDIASLTPEELQEAQNEGWK